MAARVCGCMTMADGPWGDVMTYTSTTHTLPPPVTGPLALSLSCRAYVR